MSEVQMPAAPAGPDGKDSRTEASRAVLVVSLAWLVIAFIVLYSTTIYWLVDDWSVNGDFSHGYLIPPLVLYMAWDRRATLRALPMAPLRSGLPVVLVALAMMAFGTLSAETFLTRVSIPVLVAGTVLFTLGAAHLRALLFPIACLLLMIPIPNIIYNQLTLPLQLLASSVGESGLRAMSIPVLREGNVIVLPSATLEVAEACSGIRSLMSLFTLTVVFGYFCEPRLWVRGLLVVATVPIAILCNALRVAATGIAAYWYGDHVATGAVHSAAGFAVFVVALALILGLQRLISAGLSIGPKGTLDAALGGVQQ